MKNSKSGFNWEKEQIFLNVVKGLEIACSRPFMEVDFVYIPLLIPAASVESRRRSSVTSSGNHWCLAVWNVKGRYITLYDSFFSPGSSFVSDYVSKFCQVLSSAFSYLKVLGYVDNLSEIDILWGSYTIQTTRTDCGIFMIKYAEMLMMNKSILLVQQKQVKDYRKQLAVDLWSHGTWKQQNGYETPLEMLDHDYGDHKHVQPICHSQPE
ncbi:hypothetical protein UlMin_018502 [Ulmus minor]